VQTFKRSIIFTFSAFQIFVFLAAAVKPAHAYVDPGSGLLFFQMGGSMLAGALFVMRAKIRKLFGLKPKTKIEAGHDRDASESTFRSGTNG
jgi:hypothetical protein